MAVYVNYSQHQTEWMELLTKLNKVYNSRIVLNCIDSTAVQAYQNVDNASIRPTV